MLHRFDADGGHTGSQIWFAGTSEDEKTSVTRAEQCLAGWLEALPGRAFGDIAIKLFQVNVDGHRFGLVDGSELYEGQDHAEFLPDDLGFDPPWDGCYDSLRPTQVQRHGARGGEQGSAVGEVVIGPLV